MSLFNLLGLLFVGLKLAGVINWSWLWVVAPFAIGVFFTFFFLILAIIGAACSK